MQAQRCERVGVCGVMLWLLHHAGVNQKIARDKEEPGYLSGNLTVSYSNRRYGMNNYINEDCIFADSSGK